jgi:hypothetical protein
LNFTGWVNCGYFIGDIVKNTLDDPPRNTVGTFFGNILNFPTHFLIRKSPGNTVNGLITSQAGDISVKLAGKILNVLGIFWVGIGQVLCPFPCNVFVMHWVRTPPLAPSDNKGKKLDAKALPMIFVSYEPGSKAYRLWDPRGHKIVISSDINFDETVFPNKPEEQPVTPPTISERQDLGPQRRKKKSKGKKKAVTFVDIPEAFFLEDEERNQLLPPRAGLLGLQPRLPLPPPPAQVLPYAPAPVPADFIPPIVQIQHRAPSSAGSTPGTPCRVPPPATREATRSPSPDHHPTWRSPSLKYESSDSEEEVENRLLPSPEVTINLSTLAQPSSTPAPTSTIHTPSSITMDLSDHYVSPDSESQHSDSSLPHTGGGGTWISVGTC